MRQGKKMLGMLLALCMVLALLAVPAAASATWVEAEVHPYTRYSSGNYTGFSEGMMAVWMIDKDSQRKYGFVNTAGELVVPCQYSRVYDYSEGLAQVMDADGHYGFIDKTGKVVVPLEYDDAGDFSGGAVWVMKGEQYGLVNASGELLLPTEYDAGLRVFNDGVASLARATEEGQSVAPYGYVNTKGEIVVPMEYEAAREFYDGVGVVRKNGKWGAVNASGQLIIPCEYSYLSNFSDGLATGRKDGEYIVFNTAGQVVFTTSYSVGSFHDGIAVIRAESGNGRSLSGFIDNTGKVLVEPIYTVAYDFRDGYANVGLGDWDDLKYGYIDKTGRVIVPIEYSGDMGRGGNIQNGLITMTVWDENGQNPVYTTYNSQGEVVDRTGPYDSVGNYSEGLAPVTKDGKTGYIDTEGQLIIPLIYDSGDHFEHGVAQVGVFNEDGSGGHGYIDHNGYVLIEPMNVNYLAIDNGLVVVEDINNNRWGFMPLPNTFFADVPSTQYYAKAVSWAVAQGITNGTGVETFSPNTTCSHVEIVTFLYRAAGSPAAAEAAPIQVESWFVDAVNWAYGEGIIDVGFDPTADCTRADTVAYMWKAAGSPDPQGAASFSDVPAGAEYAQAVAWAAETNITTGTGEGVFSPDVTCSRAQIVTFLSRAYAD